MNKDSSKKSGTNFKKKKKVFILGPSDHQVSVPSDRQSVEDKRPAVNFVGEIGLRFIDRQSWISNKGTLDCKVSALQ